MPKFPFCGVLGCEAPAETGQWCNRHVHWEDRERDEKAWLAANPVKSDWPRCTEMFCFKPAMPGTDRCFEHRQATFRLCGYEGCKRPPLAPSTYCAKHEAIYAELTRRAEIERCIVAGCRARAAPDSRRCLAHITAAAPVPDAAADPRRAEAKAIPPWLEGRVAYGDDYSEFDGSGKAMRRAQKDARRETRQRRNERPKMSAEAPRRRYGGDE